MTTFFLICKSLDNTFSRNTPKVLTYTVALGNSEDVKEHRDEVSGWLLKKKRKRMQGKQLQFDFPPSYGY